MNTKAMHHASAGVPVRSPRASHTASAWASACMLAVAVEAGDCPPPPAILVNPVTTSEDGLGDAVGLCPGKDAFALMGNPTDDFVGTNSGSVAMFRPSGAGWIVVDTFAAPATDADDRFGSSLSLRGDVFVVGAPMRTVGSLFSAGSVSVFRYEPGSDALDWAHEADLLAPLPEAIEQFGNAVATDGIDTIVVGNAADDVLGNGVGSAHVYRRIGGFWTFEQTLLPAAPAPTASFGRAVAIDGERIVVGAPGAFGASGVGAASVFRRENGTWVLEQKLDTPAPGDYFGHDVAIVGDRIVVGAPFDDERAVDAGAVHVFGLEDQGWSHHAKLVAAIAAPADRLGWAVAVEGSAVAAGAYVADGVVANSGAAHVFAEAGGAWSERARLLDQAGTSQAAFGWSLTLREGQLLVAAPSMNPPGPQTGGGALLFDIACLLEAPPGTADLDGDGGVDGADLGLLLAAWGPAVPGGGGTEAADLDGDGAVAERDLQLLLAAWSR